MRKILSTLFCLLFAVPVFAQYSQRIHVTFNNPPASTLTHFPGLISLSNSVLKTVGNGGVVTSASGYDIAPYSDSACTTKLNFEVEKWDGVNGTWLAWVDLPTFASSSPAPIYVCEGNSAILSSQQTPATLWANANYVRVYHLGDGSTVSATDSAGIASLTSAAGTAIAAEVLGGSSLTSSQTMGSNISTSVPVGTAARTIETWFKLVTPVSNDNVIAGYGADSAAYAFDYYNNASGGGGCTGGTLLQTWTVTNGGCFPWSADTNWHFITSTLTAGGTSYASIAMTLDGVSKSVVTNGTSGPINTTFSYVRIDGTPSGSVAKTNEQIDEFRIASVAQSADWEHENYLTQSSPATFISYTVESASSFSISPSAIPANHAGNITLTLAGAGTTWTSGETTFNVTGATKVSQNVTSNTAATVVVTTSTAGTLTVTESGTGTASSGITVAAETLSVSPNSSAAGTTPTVTLTGTNTLWTQEILAGLFTVSGGTGASIGTPTCSTNTSCVATLTTGSTNGTLTITDSKTSVTTSFSVTASLQSITPTVIPSGHSGNITLTLVGSGTTWTGGGTTFTISGVTGASKATQNVTDGTHATVVVTTGSGTGTLTVSDGTYSNTVTVSTPSLSISPTSGNTGTTPTLTLTGTNTLWQSETLSGLFTESGGTGASLSGCSVSSNTAATCTLTVGSAGATETITDTSTGKTASFTAIAGVVVVSFPNANVTASPYNWRLPGDGSMWATAHGGAYFKFSVSGTTQVIANVDTSINSGVSATDMPFFEVIVDDSQPVFVQLTSGATQITLKSGLASGSTHTVMVWAMPGGTSTSLWLSASGQLHLQSLQFDSGSTVGAYPTMYAKNCLVYTDSYGEPYNGMPYTSGTTPLYNVLQPSYSWAFQMGKAMGCEVGVIAVGSQGYSHSGNNGYPSLPSSWNYYDSTHTRSFSPAPDYIIGAHGINDHGANQTTLKNTIVSWLTSVRAALSSAKIWLYAPVGGQSGDEDGTGGANHTAISNAVTAFGDANTFLIDSGTQLVSADNWSYNTWFNSPGGDALHPAYTTHGILAGYAINAIQKALGGKSEGAWAFSN